MRPEPNEPITEQLPVTSLTPLDGAAPRLRLPNSVAGIGMAAVVTLLAGAWAGIAPFAGPRFGYAPAGAGPWHWQLTDAVLNAVPGATAVLAALVMLLALRRVRIGAGRAALVAAGVLAVAAGAWLVAGAWVLPLVADVTSPFVHVAGGATVLRLVGCQLGPGLLLVAAGTAAGVLGNQHRTVRFGIVYP